MIMKETIVDSGDNSGLKKALCINLPGNSSKRYGLIGTILVFTTKKIKIKKNQRVKKKGLYQGLIIGTKKKITRYDGTSLKFDRNRVLAFTKQEKFLGTRVYGAISKEIRALAKKNLNYKKIVSYSRAVF